MKKLFKLTEKDLEMVSGGIISTIIRSTVSGIKNNIPVIAPISYVASSINSMAGLRQLCSSVCNLTNDEVIRQNYNEAIISLVAYGVGGTIAGLLPGVVGFMLGKRTLNSHSSDKKAN